VIEVFARLNQAVPGRLLLVGDGPQRTVVQEQVDALALTERVRFLGQVESMELIYPLADLVLLPSLHESFGLVALEAMSCGAVVIATAVGGTGEFIDSGHNGFLCDPADVEGMVTVGLRVLQDDSFRRQLATEARRDAVLQFGARCVLRRYLELYDRLVDGCGPASPRNG